MTAVGALGRARPAVPRPIAARWRPPVVIGAALAIAIGLRWAGTRAGLDALGVGTGFGLGLVAVWATNRRRASQSWRAFLPRRGVRALARPLAVGAVVGLVLAGLAVVGAFGGGATLFTGFGRPGAPYAPWAIVTILVATAEEAILRGVLFAALTRAGGVVVAVGLTTIAFALMHVPLYGWHVVPLDLAVGLVLGGLRVATGGFAAPAAAHAVADLATWWL